MSSLHAILSDPLSETLTYPSVGFGVSGAAGGGVGAPMQAKQSILVGEGRVPSDGLGSARSTVAGTAATLMSGTSRHMSLGGSAPHPRNRSREVVLCRSSIEPILTVSGYRNGEYILGAAYIKQAGHNISAL